MTNDNEWTRYIRGSVPAQPVDLKAKVSKQSVELTWKDPHRRKTATTARGSTTRYNVATNSNQLQDNTNACTESKEQDSNPEAQ